MKIGTLVGQENVKLSANEQKQFDSMIMDSMKSYFPDNAIESIWKGKDDCGLFASILGDMFEPRKPLRCNRTDVKAQCVKGDIFVPILFKFYLGKERCYNEQEVGKAYEWENGFKPELNYTNYSMRLALYGNQRHYKCHEILPNVGIIWEYGYGTEMTDLKQECDSFFCRLRDLLAYSVEDKGCKEYKAYKGI